jgi:hypothetical protein
MSPLLIIVTWASPTEAPPTRRPRRKSNAAGHSRPLFKTKVRGLSWLYDINPVRSPRKPRLIHGKPESTRGKPGLAAQKLPGNLDHDLGSDLEQAVALVGQVNESRFR